MKSERPKTFEELKQLVDNGDIEVWIEEDISDTLTRYFILDRRRTYEEGELYELIL
jgi:hypothetical protein